MKMAEFTKITEQRVRHISGYEVYSAGRDYIGYKDACSTYKMYYEFGWDIPFEKGIMYIYINLIYDENLNLIILSDKDRQNLIEKFVNDIKFMTYFRIVVTS